MSDTLSTWMITSYSTGIVLVLIGLLLRKSLRI